MYPVIYTDPSLAIATPLPISASEVPINLVQAFVPSEEYFERKISLDPAFVSPSKSPDVRPVIYIDPSLAVATPLLKSELEVPNNFVHAFVPSESYFVRNAS